MQLRIFLFFLLIIGLSFSAEPQQGKKPKNIIIIIGDGMGLNQVSSEIIFNREDTPFKKFTDVGMSVTCAADALITDSAAGGTAISTGHKSYNGAIAVDTLKQPLQTIFEYAVTKKKKVAGLVSTAPITDATPAVFFAHAESRKMHTEIAQQLVNAPVHVVIGGGRKYFLPQDQGGVRTDGVNLLQSITDNGYVYSSEYISEGYKPHSKLWMLLDTNAITKAGTRSFSLGDLAMTAIGQLKNHKDGFLLMVESTHIDYAGHANDAVNLKSEMEEFADLLHRMLAFIEKDGNTLLVVTADHETGGMSLVHPKDKSQPIEYAYTTKGHSAGIVGVWAKGPGSELFRGVYENNEIGLKLFSIAKSWK
ncbi:MAG: alkaline phosphatase [Ignavibacteriales bacterium]|jgi:alkaline phosphatase